MADDGLRGQVTFWKWNAAKTSLGCCMLHAARRVLAARDSGVEVAGLGLLTGKTDS